MCAKIGNFEGPRVSAFFLAMLLLSRDSLILSLKHA